MIPSKYQEKIFDEIKNGKGNILIEACAGAGKTTTIVESLSLIDPKKSVLFLAFNKSIVDELKKRTSKYKNVETMTLHSLGFRILRGYFGETISVDNFKYDTYLRESFDYFSKIFFVPKSWRKKIDYFKNIRKYIDLGRFYLCQTVKDMAFLDERYGITPIGDEKEIAINILQWGQKDISKVDYTDMIWLPNVLDLDVFPFDYDFIMIDEVQDLDKSKRELILKCANENTRLCSVGDSHQCIYSFSGSDPQSFSEFKAIPNTVCLPLSISYRCADSIVDNAKKIVPSIEKNEDGRMGKILKNVKYDAIKDGDLVLCRNNAPLFQLYCTYLNMGKKCNILGKDVGKTLIATLRQIPEEELNVSCDKSGVFSKLYLDMFEERDKIMERSKLDKETAMTSSIIQSMLDTIMALETLSHGIRTKTELIDKINAIFVDKELREGITLSTIHKAKGLEADNVYIACNSLMPSKSAKLEWEREQEYNLMYVAYTRAKNVLGFIDEKDFKKFNFFDIDNMSYLDTMEAKINNLYNKSSVMTLELANSIISRAMSISGEPKNLKTLEKKTKQKRTLSQKYQNKHKKWVK